MKKVYFTLSLIILTNLGLAQNNFTFEMYNTMPKDNNILFSPTSIKTAFALAYEGANGETQKELEDVFGFKEDNSRFINELNSLKENAKISNSIWILENYEILSSFIDKLKVNFNSKPNSADFNNDPEGSAKKINDWISESTNGMIKKMLNSENVIGLKMVLVNAIYFKKNWKKQFESKYTKKEEFTNLDGSKVEVDMMINSFRFNALQDIKEDVIELPYEGDETSMIIILPHKMKGYKLTDERYQSLTKKMVHQKVSLHLPKFEFETPTFSLTSQLKKLGLKSAFTEDADFSGIRTEKDLHIGTALHKAKIIVSESGTEAAAATVITGRGNRAVSMSTPIFEFRADRPFFYFIKDNSTGSIMFMGRMNEMKDAN